MGALLAGRRYLITGILTRHSIAFAVAKRVQEEGGEVLATAPARTRRLTERTLQGLPNRCPLLELDVGEEEQVAALGEAVGEAPLHGLLHAVAYAPPQALGEDFLACDREGASRAFEISAYSLAALVRALRRPLAAGEGAVVALSFQSSVAWPSYNWMGVAKAALESTARYLARTVGPAGVRVNVVSAGPLESAAASAIPGFDGLLGLWQAAAPLRWDPTDAGPVADGVIFLLSPWSRGISGAVLPVDGGLHAQAPVPDGAALHIGEGQRPAVPGPPALTRTSPRRPR